MNPKRIPKVFTPISQSGSRLKPLAFFVAVAISGGAAAADGKPLELDATQIEDSALLPADDAGQLGYTVESTRSSTGLALTPRQTPQSVTTITRQQMDDRDIHTIEQALETTPGVTANKSEVGGVPTTVPVVTRSATGRSTACRPRAGPISVAAAMR